MLLQEVNDRYTYITKAYQHADAPYSLEKICALMRDDDAKFQEVNKTPAIGSATFLNAVESHAEIRYAQRHGGGDQPRDAQSTVESQSYLLLLWSNRSHQNRMQTAQTAMRFLQSIWSSAINLSKFSQPAI